jgi:hypothetical protein
VNLISRGVESVFVANRSSRERSGSPAASAGRAAGLDAVEAELEDGGHRRRLDRLPRGHVLSAEQVERAMRCPQGAARSSSLTSPSRATSIPP